MKELGEAKKILGMEIVRDRNIGKSVKMPIGVALSKLSLKYCPVRDYDVERLSKVPYANAVGRLMYLMVYMRPDIAYALSVVSKYLANMAVKIHWGYAVSWKAMLQHVVALSTTEADYMALMEAIEGKLIACRSVSLKFRTVFKFCLMSLNLSLNFENAYMALTTTQLEYGGNAIDLSCRIQKNLLNRVSQLH
ncbi:hypothetical protein Tco_1367511 [Tanacetum coccineum]